MLPRRSAARLAAAAASQSRSGALACRRPRGCDKIAGVSNRRLQTIAACSGALLLSGCGGDYWLGGLPNGAGGTAGNGGSAGAAARPTEELTADVVLTGDDTFERGDQPCVIEGHGHSIRSVEPWHGHLWLHDCRLVNVGRETQPSLDLVMNEGAWTKVERCTFDSSGRVRVNNAADSTTIFAENTLLGNALLAEPPLRDDALPIFTAEGWDGTGSKVFRGNKLFKGFVLFGKTAHWLIGGDTAADSNIIVGRRAGIDLWGSDFVVRGNYVHDIYVTSPDQPLGNQESALGVVYETTPDVLIEHNVLRKGHWVVRGVTGEFRYNAVLDPGSSGWLQQPFENTKVHHNLFLTYAYSGEEQGLASGSTHIESGLSLVNFRKTGIEVFNNTFDGGGLQRYFTGPALDVDADSFLDSLRNNVFMRFRFEVADDSQAAVRPPLTEGIVPMPARVGYADYNLFYAPDVPRPRNYALGVKGLTPRVDAGFGLNDAHALGPLDEQVDPQFRQEPPLSLPFSEGDVVSGKLSVWQVLAQLRELYTPAAQSPLVDAGDPADGDGTDIGAIGAGVPQADDRFGGTQP